MNKKLYGWLLTGLLLVSQVPAWAQSQGSLDDNEVIKTTTTYVPVISEAFKLSDNPQVIDTVVSIKQGSEYQVRNKRAETEFEAKPIKPAKMKGERLNKLYRSYVLLGMGNYLTTRGELVINSTRSRQWDYGLTAWHHGSNGGVKDRGHSSFSDNNFNLYARKFFYNKILSANIRYDLNTLHKYGFNPADFPEAVQTDSLGQDQISQRFQNVEPTLRFKSYFKDSTKINYEGAVGYYHYWDKRNSTEDNVRVDFTLDRYVNQEFVRLDAWIDYNQFQVKDNSLAIRTTNSTLIGLKPLVETARGDFKLRAGAQMVLGIDGSTDFFLVPDLYVKYDLVKDILIPYVGLDGGVKRNNFRNLTRVNPYLVSDPNINLEHVKYRIYGGIRGAFSSKASFNARVSHQDMDNLALFVNEVDSISGVELNNEFDVIYDDGSVTSVYGEFGWQNVGKFNFILGAEYFRYNLKNQKAAWNMPEFKANLNTTYNLAQKISITADIFFISERKAHTTGGTGHENLGGGVFAVTLDPLIDVNLGVEYYFTKRLTAFIRLYNLANSNYNVWRNYDQQGFTILGGITYSFWGSKKRSGKRR